MKKSHRLNKALFPLLYLLPGSLFATTFNVTDQATLNSALVAAVGGDIISFQNDISLLGGLLRPINTNNDFSPNPISITINGNGFNLIGATSPREFFVRAGTLAINNLNFKNGVAPGGPGGASGGGGGAGMGGALFVAYGSTVTLLNPTFTGCAALGGAGAAGATDNNSTSNLPPPGGGGGLNGFSGGSGSGGTVANGPMGGGGAGFGGAGGSVADVNALCGGGGGAGFPGGAGTDASAGAGGGDFAGANGGVPPSGAGGSGGGGAGGNIGGSGGFGGFVGGGGGGGNNGLGGSAAPYAAGGGGNFGGSGFYGGGGGAGLTNSDFPGGFGGFGAGGGGSLSYITAGGTGGSSSFLGGTGGFGGGGGAGMGGAIFLEGPLLGPAGSLTIQVDSSFTGSMFNGSNIAGGVGGAVGGTNGGFAGFDIFMESDSQLTFNISNNTIAVPNPIESDQTAGGFSTGTVGGLIKQGNGLLQLTGANTYTGLTNVQAGELNIQGSVVSEIQVQAGATLSGSFTANKIPSNPNSGNLTNSGTVSPGGTSVGQINLQGNYIQNGSGTLLVDITPTGNVNDKLFLTMGGTVTLAGTLNVVVDNGNYIAGTTYTIINAPVTGTFGTVVKSGPQANSVNIGVSYSSVVITILNSQLFTHQNITSGVPTKVANALKNANIAPGSDLATVVEVLGTLTDPEVNAALLSLAPTNFAAVGLATARNNSYVAYLLSKHLTQLPCSPRDCCECGTNSSIWVTGFGNLMNNYEKFDNLMPYDANAGGALVGMDYCWMGCESSAYYFGGALGYTHTEINFKNHTTRSWVNSYYGALYGSYSSGCHLDIDASVLAGGNNQNFRRHMSFGIINRIARSDPWGWFATGHLGISSDWTFCDWTFEPFALADYHYFHSDGFKEKGAISINLVTKSSNTQILRGEAGMVFYRDWNYDCNCCFSPYIGLSWVGEFPLQDVHEKAHFIDQSAATMNITSYHNSIQLASPQAGVRWSRNSGFSVDVGYKGLYNSKTSINEVEGRLEWVF